MTMPAGRFKSRPQGSRPCVTEPASRHPKETGTMNLLWLGKDAGIGERAIACGAGPSGQSSLAPVGRLANHRQLVVHVVMALIFCFAAGALEPARAQQSWANVDGARVEAAVQDGANWMTYGRTYSEQRFSPLTQINADNANQLGLVGYTDLDVIDGKPELSRGWRQRRWRSTACCTFRPRGAMSEHSMPRPVNRYGFMMPKCPGRMPSGGAATWSIEAWPRGRERSSSARSTAGWWRSMPRPARRSGPPGSSKWTRRSPSQGRRGSSKARC